MALIDNSEELPHIVISLDDLKALDAVIESHQVYLRKCRVKDGDAQIEHLRDLRKRMALISPEDVLMAVMPLTVDDLKALEEVLACFCKRARKIIPPARERDDLLRYLDNLRQRLAQMRAGRLN